MKGMKRFRRDNTNHGSNGLSFEMDTERAVTQRTFAIARERADLNAQHGTVRVLVKDGRAVPQEGAEIPQAGATC